jgi:hypothetical protein
MANSSSTTRPDSNHYNAEAACQHCGQMLQHEAWCITHNPVVQYAYQIISEPGKLTIGDTLILHSLGVTWGGMIRECCGS